MEDAGAHRADGNGSLEVALLWDGHGIGCFDDEIGMRNMCRVINGETKSNNQDDSDDTVHSQTPELDESEKEQIDEGDSEDDKQSHGDTTSDKEDDQEHCNHREAHTSESLLDKHDVLLEVEQGSGRIVNFSEFVLVCNFSEVFQIYRSINSIILNTIGSCILSPSLNSA